MQTTRVSPRFHFASRASRSATFSPPCTTSARTPAARKSSANCSHAATVPPNTTAIVPGACERYESTGRCTISFPRSAFFARWMSTGTSSPAARNSEYDAATIISSNPCSALPSARSGVAVSPMRTFPWYASATRLQSLPSSRWCASSNTTTSASGAEPDDAAA